MRKLLIGGLLLSSLMFVGCGETVTPSYNTTAGEEQAITDDARTLTADKFQSQFELTSFEHVDSTVKIYTVRRKVDDEEYMIVVSKGQSGSSAGVGVSIIKLEKIN